MTSTNSRINDENPYQHIRQKNNDDWFLYWICEDPEFKQLMDAYVGIYEQSVKMENGKIVTEMSDKEKRKGEKLRLKIIQTFGITENEFDTIQTGLHTQGSFDFPYEIIGNGIETLDIRIPRNIKKNEYIHAWDELSEFLRQIHGNPLLEVKIDRIRAADDTQLIYAVFKARRKNLTFRQIFELYQKGTLPSYKDKPTNQFSSEDSLERYYNKYKPVR